MRGWWIGALIMSLPSSVADVIDKHVVFTTESIDRMYLNVYQPGLQIEPGAAMFFRGHRFGRYPPAGRAAC